MSAALDVACPACEEPAGKKCRTFKTRRITDTHVIRYDAAWEAREMERRAAGSYPVDVALSMLRDKR